MNAAPILLKIPTTIISSGQLERVEVNRCDEVKQWENKIVYYQNLNELNDADLKNKTGLLRNEIKNTLIDLGKGIQKVKEQCNLKIAEPVKPVAVQSAQEIDTYYKAKIENISAVQNASQQVEKLHI